MTHILIRGRGDDGKDLVISRAYISQGPPVVTYNGLLAPRRTPDDIVAAIVRELRNGVEFQDRLAKVGADPFVSTPEEFSRIIAADIVQWRNIVRDLNLKTQ